MVQSEIVPDNRPSNAFLRFFWHLFGPPSLASDALCQERDRVFCMAKVPLDHADVVSERVLQTVYMRLTGTLVDQCVPRDGVTAGGVTLPGAVCRCGCAGGCGRQSTVCAGAGTALGHRRLPRSVACPWAPGTRCQ